MSSIQPDKTITYKEQHREFVFTAPTLPDALRKAALWIEAEVPLNDLARFSPLIQDIQIQPSIDSDDNTRFIFNVIVCFRDEHTWA